MARDPYKYFRLEARELLTQFGAEMLELEKSGNSSNQIQRLLRLAHTLKGAARVVKLPDIADRAHAIEDTLSPLRESTDGVPRACIDTILKYLDDIGERLQALTSVDSAVASTSSGISHTPLPEERLRTVRADIAEMDALLDGVVETHTALNGLRSGPQRIEQAQHLTALLLAQLARPAREGTRQPLVNFDRAHATAEDLWKNLGGLKSFLGRAVDQMDRELQQLRDTAEQLRLVSAGALFTSLERLARDVARTLGKQVTFESAGGDIHLDAYVLNGVQSALVQIIRNAVAHGIESERERRAAGKTTAGHIALSVSRRGRQILFQCHDDGSGVDLEAVRRVAAQRGLLEADAQPLGAEELIRLLLRGGISTSESITDTSGRGVGLDVVREAIEQLRGNIVVRTEAGKGTTFELAVPLSVTSLEGLVVEAAGSAVTIPLDAVRTVVRVISDEISETASGASILFEGNSIPFVSLPRALFGTRGAGRQVWSTVILAGGENLAAVGVDRLLGTARVVVRPLADLVPVGTLVAGASLDAEGNPQLVLDPEGLVAEAQHGRAAELEPPQAERPILVIDDSLTTRMLEQSILESAGYEVDVAISGEEGLESARRKHYALILVDVEMPGMDGFTFVEQIRADPALHDIPAILVTSRNAPEDLQRGKDVRAQGYVIKSEFDQTKLLAMIKPLIGR